MHGRSFFIFSQKSFSLNRMKCLCKMHSDDIITYSARYALMRLSHILQDIHWWAGQAFTQYTQWLSCPSRTHFKGCFERFNGSLTLPGIYNDKSCHIGKKSRICGIGNYNNNNFFVCELPIGNSRRQAKESALAERVTARWFVPKAYLLSFLFYSTLFFSTLFFSFLFYSFLFLSYLERHVTSR